MSATRERGARLGDALNRVARDARERVGSIRGGMGGVRDGLGGVRGGLGSVRGGLGARAGTGRGAGRTAGRGARSSWLAARRNPRATLAGALAGLMVILGLFYLWFRDSPFVTISRVQVTGLSGPQIPQIEEALRTAAMKMSTLDVNLAGLRKAVSPYRQVTSLNVQTSFPHGAVIHVSEEVAIAQINLGARTVAVSRDGTLLPSTGADSRLPRIPVGVLPTGGRLTQAGPRTALAVLAAAPYSFLTHVQSVTRTAQNGLVAQLRHGPQLRFGDTAQLRAKWQAALAVLGNPSSQGATYIDVTDPGRPAAGAETATSSASTSSTTTSSTPAAPTTGGATTNTASSASTGAATPATPAGSTSPATAGPTGATNTAQGAG